MALRLPPWFGVAAKLTLTVVLVALIAGKVDLADAFQRVAQLPVWAGLVALALTAAHMSLNAVRWRVIAAADGGHLPLGLAVRSVFQGLFFNQALPSVVGGDALRVLQATRTGMDAGQAVRSVVLDRVAGVGALVLLAALSQPLFLARVDAVAPRVASLGIVAVGLGGLFVLLALASLPVDWRRFRAIGAAVSLSRSARSVCGVPGRFGVVLGLSLLGHCSFLIGVTILAAGLDLDFGFADCLAVVPIALLLAMAPVSIAGWGVREGVMVAGLGLLGVEPGGALALSVLMGLAILAASLPGGVAWLLDAVRSRGPALPDPAGAREPGV